MWRKLGICAVVWMLASCGNQVEKPIKNPTQIDTYFPISDFINKQIDGLEGVDLRKDLYVNGDHEQVRQQLTREQWRSELDWFIQADINKASLATAYDIVDENGTTSYRLKPGENSNIEEMTVIYDGDRVDEILVKAFDKNTFYQSETMAKLSTDPVSGNLSTYELETTQKVLLLSPRVLKVKSQVEQP
ncbi:hypothetical protein KI659_05790 [Litoribacter alkaliphilus]|uniref:Uncharacterized protein n=1 Tax=Litoribacter ruber TaxID=702568 RepID=A0AAP2CH63_9BACT|nr:hypothetical protein [Litoribacter alkaliphilus]MBS9523529.1 hypothetical protein [Litoribacter alkaliphilus]